MSSTFPIYDPKSTATYAQAFRHSAEDVRIQPTNLHQRLCALRRFFVMLFTLSSALWLIICPQLCCGSALRTKLGA